MITPSETKSHSEQLLSEIYARRASKKSSKSVYKNCGCIDFYVLDYQNSSLKILSNS